MEDNSVLKNKLFLNHTNHSYAFLSCIFELEILSHPLFFLCSHSFNVHPYLDGKNSIHTGCKHHLLHPLIHHLETHKDRSKFTK
jgi:hypothetical protein